MTNSRQKGARGEREAAAEVRQHWLATEAIRGQQRSGLEESDIVRALPGFHVEVKRLKRVGACRFMDQAARDAGGESRPVVLLREDRGEWLVVLRLADSFDFKRALEENAAAHNNYDEVMAHEEGYYDDN